MDLEAQLHPVTFASVGGIDEVRDELVQVVDFLRTPDLYWQLNCELPRGVLLVGEPGTGKTLLARAVAGEAGVPFLHIAGSEFVEIYAGLGASRVRKLFADARKQGSAIVFIDEIDAVGSRRHAASVSGDSEQDRTLNQLLAEMDGFRGRSQVVVLAATNRADVLDSALLRPGRFDQQITVHVPDRAGRLAILEIHCQRLPLASDVDLNLWAGRTTGWTGAH
ncbi:MAG: AAA family ATPase, partial [Candidatus Dormibacteria bacterium]